MDDYAALRPVDDFEGAGEVYPGEDQVGKTPVDVIAGLVEIIEAPNLVDLIGDQKEAEIVELVLNEFEIDETSQSDWLGKAKKGVELAALVAEEKSYPWPNAANIKFPLIASAALQFNARALPAVVPSAELVKARVNGRDHSGKKAARGERAAEYQSFVMRKRMVEWEADTDKLLVRLPIEGQLYRKIWRDPVRNRPRSKLLSGSSVIVNQATKVLTEAPRISEIVFLYPNEIEERQRDGRFREMDYTNMHGERDDEMSVDGAFAASDDSESPQEFVEQHRFLDLDGDGYREPYIVTVHKEARKIVRIVANFRAEDVRLSVDGRNASLAQALQIRQIMAQQGIGFGADVRVLAIERQQHFVSYQLLPSFDGTHNGVGLGYLLATHSEAINGLINMLLDSGHLASLGGGFIGQGLNMNEGQTRLRPGQFKTINSAGADIRGAIVQLDFPEPSPTLFQLLGLLIDAGREIASVNEVMTGDTPGGSQVQPTTLLALIDQGMAVFSAAFKRIFRSLTQEYNLIAQHIAEGGDEQDYAAFHDFEGQQQQQQPPPMMMAPGMPMPPQEEPPSLAGDFALADMDIEPVADPQSVTKMQKMAQAQLLREMQASGELPPGSATRRVLQAAGVSDIDDLLPEPDPGQVAQEQEKAKALEQMALRGQKAEIAKTEAEAKRAEADAIKTAAEAQVVGIEQGSGPVEDPMAKRAIEAEKLNIARTKADADVAASMAKLEIEQRKSAAEIAKKAAEIDKLRFDMAGADPIERSRLTLESQRVDIEERRLRHDQRERSSGVAG